MSKTVEKALKMLAKRRAKRVGVARLRARNGAVLEFDLVPPRDSIISYSDGSTFVIIRREGYLIRGWIRRVYLSDKTVVYEGEVVHFSSPFKFKKFRKLKKKALSEV